MEAFWKRQTAAERAATGDIARQDGLADGRRQNRSTCSRLTSRRSPVRARAPPTPNPPEQRELSVSLCPPPGDLGPDPVSLERRTGLMVALAVGASSLRSAATTARLRGCYFFDRLLLALRADALRRCAFARRVLAALRPAALRSARPTWSRNSDTEASSRATASRNGLGACLPPFACEGSAVSRRATFLRTPLPRSRR